MSNVTNAIETWKTAAKVVIETRGRYIRKFGAAFTGSEAKTEAARKADADAQAIDERAAFALAVIEEQAARWLVQVATGARVEAVDGAVEFAHAIGSAAA